MVVSLNYYNTSALSIHTFASVLLVIIYGVAADRRLSIANIR